MIALRVCHQRLAVLWLAGSTLALALMLIFLVHRYFDGSASGAFGWFFPLVLPTLGLIVAVFGSSAFDDKLGSRTVDRFFFRVAFGVSTAYLVALVLTLYLVPFEVHGEPSQPALQWLQQASLFLGPMQGLAAASLGYLFVKK